MAALKRNILGGHVADVVAAQHAPAAMRYDGGDLTTLMKGMVSSFYSRCQRALHSGRFRMRACGACGWRTGERGRRGR